MGFRAIPGRRFALAADDVRLGRDVVVSEFVSLHGCTIGNESRIGPSVETERGATIDRRCRIQCRDFTCDGVTIEDGVFVGHSVLFKNGNHPNVANTIAGTWTSRVGPGAKMGSRAIVLGDVTVGAGATVGAVISQDVPPGATVVGVPAPISRYGRGGATADPPCTDDLAGEAPAFRPRE
jgi:acetyltransferase-like isoleucine patch superfamily enzyme